MKSQTLGVNEASRQYGIPSRTLRRHVNGGLAEKPGPAPTLTPAEEDAVVEGLVTRARKGFPATRLHLKAAIVDIVSVGRKSHFPPDSPSRKWIANFLERHNARVSMRKARILGSSRVNAVCKDEILMFFAEYEDFLNTHDLDATRIYNCDETGIDPQGGSPVKVIGARGAKNISVRRGCNRENTSVLMAVSASGVMIPPLFIFKGKRVPSNLLQGAPPASKVTVSENAFVDADIFDQWIDHFIESISAARPVLLTLDNHSAHIALSVRKKCVANGIHLLSFPPHTTHILQPMDAGCFRSFKSNWRKVVDDWSMRTLGQSIERKDRAKLIGTALTTAMTPLVVQKSWEPTGIWPLDYGAVEKDILSRDTADTSRFAKYDITHDALPIGDLRGRGVRGLHRNGLKLSELRCYKLTVREIQRELTVAEKKKQARRTLIEVGPQRLLTHDLCMREETKKEERKNQAGEITLMKAEDALSKKMRARSVTEEKRAVVSEKRRTAATQKAQHRLEKQREREARAKLKLQKRAISTNKEPARKRTKTARSAQCQSVPSGDCTEVHQLCPACFVWHSGSQCPVGTSTVV